MRSVFYYHLPLADLDARLALPTDAEVLCVRHHDGEFNLRLYALIDPDNPFETRTFRVFGTGQDIPDVGLKYVGTVGQSGNSLIWHVFEQIKQQP